MIGRYRVTASTAGSAAPSTSSRVEPGGQVHVYDAFYHELLADRRVVFSYDMHLGEEHVSVSLTTIQLDPVEGSTRLDLHRARD